MAQMTTKTVEQQGFEILIDLSIRTAKNHLDLIRMEDVVFLMQYMATHLTKGDAQFEDPFVCHLKIASALVTASPDFLYHFKKLSELLCNFVSDADVLKVKFLGRLLNKWHICLAKIAAQHRWRLGCSLRAQFANCVRFMVKAKSFSSQLTMLEILSLYHGHSMTDFLRKSKLPATGLMYVNSNSWIDTMAYKQNLLGYINMSRPYDDLILSKPLRSVTIGQMMASFSEQETWLHWNEQYGTFEFWMGEMKVTINTNQLKQLEMKSDELGLVFTLSNPPVFENKFGKQLHPPFFQATLVEVITASQFQCAWWHPLNHTFHGKFGYEKKSM